MQGKMIVLEGLEATGKTTLANLIKESLLVEGKEVIITREPGGIESAEFIRKAIMGFEVESISELLLFAAARREHLIKKVIPALEQGKIVICDRFVLSSYAYQGYGQGINLVDVDNIQRLVCGDYVPDMTFFIDVSVEVSMERKRRMTEDNKNRLDKQEYEFYKRARKGYKDIIGRSCEGVKIELGEVHEIKGEKSIDEIKKEIISKIKGIV